MAKVDLDALRDLAGLVEDYDVIAPKNCSWEGPDDWPSAKAYRDALRAAADELALARAVVEAAASSGNFEDYIFEGRRPERPGDARLYDALAAYRAKVGGDETSLVRHTDERCITDGRCYCRPRGKGGV